VIGVCHDLDIVHRGLTAECIIMPDNSPVPHILHFDCARVKGLQTIAAVIDAYVRDSRYAAPEVRKNPAFAHPASDVYSLGVIAAEALAGAGLPDDSPTVLADFVADLPQKSVIPILRKMLTPAIEHRFRSMKQVASAFRANSSDAAWQEAGRATPY
jgi:serine/threonine protein kinase